MQETTKADPTFGGYAFPFQLNHYTGKVREMYFTKDGFTASIATDRISAFDCILSKEIPFKGAVLNLIAAHFLEACSDIVPTWLLSVPNPRTSIGLRCETIPVEVVVRGYLSGSLWRKYKTGERNLWGYTLPDGLKESDPLPVVMVTPTTKEKEGHDEDIAEEQIIAQGLCGSAEWESIKEVSLQLFARGTKMAAQRNLILVDTKYEFGRYRGELYLVDEVHTPDSSRYFYKEGYEERQRKGEHQPQLSKEFVREWLMEQRFTGAPGQVPPEMPDDFVQQVSERYVALYETLTGKTFSKSDAALKGDTTGKEKMYSDVRHAFARERAERSAPLVGIIMGSESDLKVMDEAALTLEEFGIPYELTVISAHRTPEDVVRYAKRAEEKGLKVIIAGAGAAAHLPGMAGAHWRVPLIGVPIKSSNSIDGWDSVLSILQMPAGVPVATMALNGAKNAALYAVQMLALFNPEIRERADAYQRSLVGKVNQMRENIGKNYHFVW